MKHGIIIIHIIAFLLGVICILGSVLMYLKNRKTEIKTYSYFLIALTLILIEQATTSYLNINAVATIYLKIIMNIISAIGCGLLVFYLPQFIHAYFEKEMDKKTTRFFWVVANIPVVVILLYYISGLQLLAIVLSNTTLLIAIVYSVFIGFKLISGINEARKRVVRNFLILTVLMIPYLVIDTWIEKLPTIGKYFPYGIMSLSVFYGVWNFMTLYYGLKEFKDLFINPTQEKAPLQKTITLDDFCDKYRITLREKEVIGLILKGYSYNKISDELVVSLATTKTHVYNIYQKTNVKSKVELINAINAINVHGNVNSLQTQ